MIQGQLENSPVCPNSDCKKLLDGFTSVGHDEKPSRGDITVCVGCAWVLVFDAELQLGVFQIEDFMQLGPQEQEDITKAQAYVISRTRRKGLH
jgi:hypothetical protein